MLQLALVPKHWSRVCYAQPGSALRQADIVASSGPGKPTEALRGYTMLQLVDIASEWDANR